MSDASIEHIRIDEKGIARLVGRRTKVSQIVIDKTSGMSVEEIHDAYPDLSLAEIHAALAYYYDHTAAIDEEIRRYHELSEEMRQKLHDPGLIAKLAARISQT